MRLLPQQYRDNMTIEELLREEALDTRLLEAIAKEMDECRVDAFREGFDLGYHEGIEA